MKPTFMCYREYFVFVFQSKQVGDLLKQQDERGGKLAVICAGTDSRFRVGVRYR